MKRAFSTLACMNASLDEIVSYAARHKMSGVEVRLDKEQKLCGFGVEDAGRIREAFAKQNVALIDLASGVSVTSCHEKKLEEAKTVVDLASAAGAKGVRIFVGAGAKYFSDPVRNDFDGIVRQIAALCTYAKTKGVEIWAETHSSFSTGAMMKNLLDAAGADNLGVIWDVIHTIEYGESPAETVRLLGGKIVHVHIKDGRFSGDRNRTAYVHTKLGEGEIPLGEILNCLNSVGYDGALSLEWELPWRPELAGCYRDTDETLEAWNAWLDRTEGNRLPVLTSDAWTTFVPEGRELADFSKGAFGDTLNIRLASGSFGVGKWLCKIPVKAGETFDFSVFCRTREAKTDVFVILTQFAADGSMTIRDHAEKAVPTANGLCFSDSVEIAEKTAFLTVELWLKGTYADVSWQQPVLVPASPVGERKVKIALVHLKPQYGSTMESNRETLTKGADAAGALHPDVIVFGEAMADRGTDLPLLESAETDRGAMCAILKKKAAEYHSYIIYNLHEKDDGEIYNSSILIGRDGNIVGKYRKTHLTVSELERGMTPGAGYPVFDADFGRIGMLICYDQYFSAPAEAVIAEGAEIIFISTAGDASHKSFARAMDGGVHLAICGMNTENDYGWKPTRVISPTGEVLAEGGEHLEIVSCEIDLNKKCRRRWLSLGAADSAVHGVYEFGKNPKSFD